MRKENKVSVERLREVLDYNPETGLLHWKKITVHTHTQRLGIVAGGKRGKKYSYVCVDKQDFPLARVAWAIMTGEYPTGVVRFKDKNPDNIKWENLHMLPHISGFDYKTREGNAVYGQTWRASCPEKSKNSWLMRNFGITYGEYKVMLESQNGCCAICGNGETAIRNGKQLALCVDHHHGSGQVRELLCRNCNNGIGDFRENPEIIKKAIAYLEKHKEKHSGENVITFKKEA